MGAQWALMRALREGRRWSIRQLAESVGISREQLGSIERGQVDNPSWETVRTLAASLGISVAMVDYFQRHPEYDDQIAEWVARQTLNGFSEDEIIRALRDRYGD